MTWSSQGTPGLVQALGELDVLVAEAVDRSDDHARRRQPGRSVARAAAAYAGTSSVPKRAPRYERQPKSFDAALQT